MTTRKRLAEAGDNSWRLSEATLDPGQTLRTQFITYEPKGFALVGFIAEPREALLLCEYTVGGKTAPWNYPVPMLRVRARSQAVIVIPSGTTVVVSVRNFRDWRVPVRVWLCGAHDMHEGIPTDIRDELNKERPS